jgi:hypothetical protein
MKNDKEELFENLYLYAFWINEDASNSYIGYGFKRKYLFSSVGGTIILVFLIGIRLLIKNLSYFYDYIFVTCCFIVLLLFILHFKNSGWFLVNKETKTIKRLSSIFNVPKSIKGKKPLSRREFLKEVK